MDFFSFLGGETNIAMDGRVISNSVLAWTKEDVGAWLRSIGLEALVPAFEANGVSGSDLKSITDDDMSESLGCSKLQIKKIRKELAKLDESAMEERETGSEIPKNTEAEKTTTASSAQGSENTSGVSENFSIPPPLTAQPVPPAYPGGAGVTPLSPPAPNQYMGPYAASAPAGYPSNNPQHGYSPQAVYNAQPPYGYQGYQPSPYAAPNPGYGGQPMPVPPQYGAGAGMPPPEWVPMHAVAPNAGNQYTSGSSQQGGCAIQ